MPSLRFLILLALSATFTSGFVSRAVRIRNRPPAAEHYLVETPWKTVIQRPLVGECPPTMTPLFMAGSNGDSPFSSSRGDGSHPTSTSLSSSIEAAVYPSMTASSSSRDFLFPDNEEQSVAEYDLSESIIRAGSSISLTNPSLNFARILVLAASALYGTNFAVVKMLDDKMPYSISATLRFSLAAIVVSALVLNGESKSAPVESVEADDRLAATIGGLEIGGFYCLGYIAQAVGLQTADASKSAFFNALAVIVVPLLDSIFRGKQMGIKEISSIGMAILGVGLLQMGPTLAAGGSASSAMSISHGDLFCLAQAIMFGIGYWRLESTSSKYPTQAGRITVGQLVGVAVGSTVFCGLTAEMPSVSELQSWLTDGFTLGALGWTALVSTALALYLETVALKAMSATELTILMTSVSLFGSAFAYVTMGEVMTPIGMVGGLMILLGCVFSSVGGGASPTLETSGEREKVSLFQEQNWQTDTSNSLEIESSSSQLPQGLFTNGTSAMLY